MSDPMPQHNERSAEEREAQRQEQIRRNQALLKLLDQWDQEDEEEQRETWEIIERMLRTYMAARASPDESFLEFCRRHEADALKVMFQSEAVQ